MPAVATSPRGAGFCHCSLAGSAGFGDVGGDADLGEKDGDNREGSKGGDAWQAFSHLVRDPPCRDGPLGHTSVF